MAEHHPSILVIYTGGTIGMVRDNPTGALRPFRFGNILELVPELKKFGFNITTYSFNPPVDSSDMKPREWSRMAEVIEANYPRFDGFVILHGTDTMAYSASALSFMFENLAKPVIFTGSQLPLDSPRTDGKENLISAIEIAAASRGGYPIVPEVAVFFKDQLLRGNRTTKSNVDNFSAFVSENYPPLAETGITIRYNTPAISKVPGTDFPFNVNLITDTRIAILKFFPGITRSIVKSILDHPDMLGIVLETFGAGNLPCDRWLLEDIREAAEGGKIILNISQCRAGRVSMGYYNNSLQLADAGVISGYDSTTEAAVTKLMVLLGNTSSHAEVVEKLKLSLRGEISL